MVGERYRDLIEAADTITSMKKHSLRMIENIERLKQMQLKPSNKIDPSTIETEKQTKRFDETTATIKLLTMLPERIARIIDKNGPLSHAALCYLLGQFVKKQLALDSPASGMLAVMPILHAKIGQLESSKLQLIVGAKRALSMSSLSEESAVDSLTALAMISDEDNFQYSEIFIKCRQTGLSELINAETTSPAEQMSEIGHHLRNTVKLFDYLFIGATGSRSPLSDFAPLTVQEIIGAKSELWTRFLPGAILEWKYGAGASITAHYQELGSLLAYQKLLTNFL